MKADYCHRFLPAVSLCKDRSVLFPSGFRGELGTYKEPVAHGVSIMKFRKIEVYLETLYIAAPFTPTSGRAQWVQRTGW